MKKKILAIALAVVLLAVAGYSTLAYFTSTDYATNTITADTLTIAINETQTGADPQTSNGPEGNGIIEIDAVPGDVISKIVKIENEPDNTPAWIRVNVTVTATPADPATPALNLSLITLDFNTTDWTKHTDGYYYYNSAVLGSTQTNALFEDVTFSTDMGNDWQGATVTIKLEAQAVQAYHNGATALLATGWPAFPVTTVTP